MMFSNIFIFVILVVFLANQAGSWHHNRHHHRIHKHRFGFSPFSNYLRTKPRYNAANERCGHNKYWNPERWGSRNSLGIVNGKDAEPNEFPWQVQLTTAENSFICGGSVLSESWVITAGHCCIDGMIAAIGYGTNNLEDPTTHVRRVVENVIHPDFPAIPDRMIWHDFCLIKADRPVPLDTWKIQPICLPKSCAETCQQEEFVWVTGYGELANGTYPRQLQKVPVQVVSDSLCEHDYHYPPGFVNKHAMLCAGNESPSEIRDSCPGDSGGPLGCFKNGYFTVDGVVSFGPYPCGKLHQPGVYAKVCTVLDWIHQTMRRQTLSDDQSRSYEEDFY